MRADDVYAILKGKIVKLTEDIKEVGDWKPIRHQGTVQTAEDLPADAKEGYMYNIATDSVYGAAGMNVVKTADGWDPMGPIVNMELYLSKEEAKKGYQPAGDYLTENKAKETYQPVGNYSTKEETEKKLNKNQGIDNAGKITGINADGDIVPVFPTGVQYNEETNLLEFGTDSNMLNKGIQLDATLKKSGYAADSATVGENIDSLKEDISTKITKFYTSNQGETHLQDSDNGKIVDMMVYGKSEQKQYSGKNLLNATLQTTTWNGVTCTNNNDGTITLNGTATADCAFIVIGRDDLKNAFGTNEELRLTGAPKGASKTGYYLQIWKNEPEVMYYDTGGGVTAKKPNANCNVAIMIVKGTVCNNLLFKPMLTTDLTATYDDFEPYTGGIPSPSPDYPQEIKRVVNPTVKVCGKNLFKATLGNITANGITCTANSDGTYILNGTCTVSTALSIIGIFNHILNEPLYLTGVPSGCGSYLALGRRDGNNILVTDGKNTKIDAGIHTDHIEFWITKGTTLNNVIFKPMLTTDPTATYNDFEPYHEQTVTLPYDLYGIKVPSGGNVIIGGQEYVSDYFDVERGKLVRRVLKFDPSLLSVRKKDDEKTLFTYDKFDNNNMYKKTHGEIIAECSHLKVTQNIAIGAEEEFKKGFHVSFYAREDNQDNNNVIYVCVPSACGTTASEFLEWSNKNAFEIIYKLATPTEIDLAPEEIAALKALATYYPTTNISVNSEQLDGYTVFNYPISMENGWNYVKQQIGDTREYIYDMDARTQDTDLQSAEAYVNSEYAVALTELEV